MHTVRNARWLILLATAACGGGSPPAGDDAPDAAAERNPPGRHDRVETFAGLERDFIVYVPELARGDTRAPVVFMLHGTSGDGEIFYNVSRWKEKADEEGLIAVFPSALTHCFFEDEDGSGTYDADERKMTTKWAAGKLGEPDGFPLCSPDDPLADDLAFFDGMLDLLDAEYSIDPARIYVSGFSNGAEMSQRLAAERSTRFAAAHGHGGVLSLDPVPSERPISVIFSVGAYDDRFEESLGPLPILLTEDLADDLQFQGIVYRSLTTYQLDEAYTYASPTIAGVAVSEFRFETSAVGATNTFRAVVIDDNDHRYPNGTNHPIEMANVLWEFFQGHVLP